MGTKVQVVLGVLAAFISIGAGLYLLTSQSASDALTGGSTVFDALMHGVGAYFVARGAWMLASVRTDSTRESHGRAADQPEDDPTRAAARRIPWS
jgi:hypothetical protein